MRRIAQEPSHLDALTDVGIQILRFASQENRCSIGKEQAMRSTHCNASASHLHHSLKGLHRGLSGDSAAPIHGFLKRGGRSRNERWPIVPACREGTRNQNSGDDQDDEGEKATHTEAENELLKTEALGRSLVDYSSNASHSSNLVTLLTTSANSSDP